jgi:UDP-glucose 4-epimerase
MLHIVVTGSSGRLGSALCEFYGAASIGIDPRKGPTTKFSDEQLEEAFSLIGDGDPFIVLHAGALHKPDMKRFNDEDFVRFNVLFTAKLLRMALSRPGMQKFVYTSTTSLFGAYMGHTECVWIDSLSIARPKNIYGLSKKWAEELICNVRKEDAPKFIILRACRFFPGKG